MAKIVVKIHSTAEVSSKAKIALGTTIWHNSHIRANTTIGKNCIIGQGVYIDRGIVIGNNVKIQNYSSIYSHAILEDGVFVGPYTCLTNDKNPRSINPDAKIKEEQDWKKGKIIIRKGASIGAGTIILPDIEIGEFAMIGAGSIVSKNIPAYALAVGSPARIKGFVCKCGVILTRKIIKPKTLVCKVCIKNQIFYQKGIKL